MKATIDIHNYEAYALDYIENKLDDQTRAAFDLFLLLHPAMAEEFAEMAALEWQLQPPTEASIPNLKLRIEPVADINERNYEKHFALAIGSKPSPSLTQFLAQNPALASEWQLYNATILVPAAAPAFALAHLKQPIPLAEKRALWWSAAASVAALLILTLATDPNVSYRPRVATADGIEIPSVPSKTVASEVNTKAQEVKANGATEVQLAASFIESESEKSPSNIPLAKAPQVPLIAAAWPEIEPQTLKAPALAMAESKPTPTVANRPQVMQWHEFVAQRWFGASPIDRSPRNLAQSLAAALNRSNHFELKNDTAGNTQLEIWAGNFEFRRVAHAKSPVRFN